MPADTQPTPNRPLAGITVLDFGQIYQGPYCSLLLAKAGADVIKIEPLTGEPLRRRALAGGQSTTLPVAMLNANKRAITLNLKDPRGRELLCRMAGRADVLLENFAPGVMDRLGIGWAALHAINPALIYATGTGYGITGPDRDNLAMDLTIQAVSGIMSVTGMPDGAPMKAGPTLVDIMGGIHLYAGITTALFERSRTGVGRLVEVAMQEAVYCSMASSMQHYHVTGEIPPRVGNHQAARSSAPYNVYETGDGHVAIHVVTEVHWQSLCTAMGREDLKTDPRFATMQDRAANMALTDAAVTAWTRTLGKMDVFAIAAKYRIPCAPVRNVAEVMNDPHMHGRDMLEWVDHPGLGRVVLPNTPLRLHGADKVPTRPSPTIGQHNEEVYGGWLGLSGQEIDELKAAGSSDPAIMDRTRQMRQMTMVAFLQAQNCTNFVGSWRHPEAMPDFTSAEYYRRIGRVLEAGKFHVGFFDDRLAMPDRFGGNHEHTVENGIRCVKMDPLIVLTVMGMATERLGLGATSSTTYFEPYDVARKFQTLDLMTNGRAAWNIVTSMNDSEAMNMGREAHLEHDLRYDRADEFLEVVTGHWDSWEDGAIVLDKATGQFADPKKVHRLDHKGKFFHSRGPFTVPRSPQGHPVLIQAGQSGRGRAFAVRWAELVFVAYHGIGNGKRDYKIMKDAVAAAGREPEDMKITSAVYPVVADTRAEAEDRVALIDKLPKDIDKLSLLSEVLNFDFATKGMDEPFSDEEIASISGVQTMRDRVMAVSGKANPTTRDFIDISGRGTFHDHTRMIGSVKDVADEMEQWFVERACDGFVVAASHVPGAYEDFVRLVVPELQRRGLYHKDYAGVTLRENLGLAKPRAVGFPGTVC